MATIEERARKSVWLMKLPFFSKPYEDLEKAYVKGATEQRNIDIDNACEVFESFSCNENTRKAFRKAMEEYDG